MQDFVHQQYVRVRVLVVVGVLPLAACVRSVRV